MRTRALVTLLALLALAGLQCKKSDSSSSPTGPSAAAIPSQLVGTWHYQSATIDGSPTDLAAMYQWEQTTVRSEMVLNSNGSFIVRELDNSDKVTYSEGGTLTVTGQVLKFTTTSVNGQQVNPNAVTWTCSVTGGLMTLSQQIQQKMYVVTLSSSPGSTGGVIPSQLVGTWKYQSATVAGFSVPLSTALDWVTGTVRAELTLSASGAYTYREIGATGSVTYTDGGTAAVTGQALRITTTSVNGQAVNPPTVIDGTWSLSGATLTVSIQTSQGMLVMTLSK